jgi:hypothetical protein
MCIKTKQCIINFKGKNIMLLPLGEGASHFHKRRKDSVLSLFVGFLLFTFDLDIGGYVPVLLRMPKRIGDGWTPAEAAFIPVEIRNKEFIAMLVKAQDREEEETSVKVLILKRSWTLLTLGP